MYLTVSKRPTFSHPLTGLSLPEKFDINIHVFPILCSPLLCFIPKPWEFGNLIVTSKTPQSSTCSCRFSPTWSHGPQIWSLRIKRMSSKVRVSILPPLLTDNMPFSTLCSFPVSISISSLSNGNDDNSIYLLGLLRLGDIVSIKYFQQYLVETKHLPHSNYYFYN